MIELVLIAAATMGFVGGESVVRGTILSDRDEPVAGALVEIPAENMIGWSDSTGAYELHGLDPGEYEIRFSRFAYEPVSLTITVPETGALRLDVRLRTRFVILPGIRVLAFGSGSKSSSAFGSGGLPEVGSRVLPAEIIWSSPLVPQPDVLTPLRTIPGIEMAEEFPTQIHVRGGSADQNLVLLDGAPVYNAYHTSGVLGAISPDVISRTVVHTGVFPARYGGRLSSVIDIEAATPAKAGVQVRGGAGLPDLRTAIEAPLPRDVGGVLIGGRRTRYDLINRENGGGIESSGFEDILGKISMSLFGGRLDIVSLRADNWLSSFVGDEAGANGEDGPPLADGEELDLHNSVRWASETDGVAWVRSAADRTQLQLRLWRAATRSHVEWGSVRERYRFRNSLEHWGAAGDLEWKGPTSVRRWGLAVEWLSSAYEAGSRALGHAPGPADPPYGLEGRPKIVSSYLEHRWIPWADWMVNGGMRAVHIEGHGPALEPRFSVHYQPGGRLTVSGGLGRVHQYIQSLANEESLLHAAYAVEPLVTAGPAGVPVARSDQLTAALEASLTDRLLLTVDGYVRWIDDIVLLAPLTPQPYATDAFAQGEGKAHGIGIDLVYRGDRTDAGVIAEWSSVRRSSGGLTYRPRFERRRSMTLTVAHRLTMQTTLRSAFQAAAGAPASSVEGGFDWELFDPLTGEVEFTGTPIRAPGPLNEERLPAYVRWDLGVGREWMLDGPGPKGSITTYVNVMNVLDRRNVLGYQLAPSGTETRELSLLRRSALFGIEWRF